MSTRNKRQWENCLILLHFKQLMYITEHNWYNWWVFVILNHVKQWKHSKQLFSYFSTNITSNCSCKLIIYAGLNQNQSSLHNNTFYFSLQKLTRVHKEGELECSSIFLKMIHWNETHLEGWGELRWPSASEADTDYNTQFDPKSQALSNHTSPGNITATPISAPCVGTRFSDWELLAVWMLFCYLVCDNLQVLCSSVMRI